MNDVYVSIFSYTIIVFVTTLFSCIIPVSFKANYFISTVGMIVVSLLLMMLHQHKYCNNNNNNINNIINNDIIFHKKQQQTQKYSNSSSTISSIVKYLFARYDYEKTIYIVNVCFC